MNPVRYLSARAKNALRFAWHKLHGYHGDFMQDRWVIRDIFGGKRGGYFVDVGAYDGYIASNTYVLEKRYGWTGICIEPNAKNFRRLQKCRACICSDACVAGKTGEVDFLEAGPWGGIIGAYPRGWDAVLSRYVRTRRIVKKCCVPLGDILRRHGAPEVIEYLSLDTEGSEADILSGVPFDQYTFLAITVEHNSIPGAREAQRRILLKNGYRVAKEGPVDDFYVYNARP
jgi:FkbM family methyltransferase